MRSMRLRGPEWRRGMVITLPSEAAKRHSDFVDLTPLARKAGSRLVHTHDINDPAVIETLRAFNTDLVLVIGWSQICRAAFRSVARIGNIGFHPGPLPRLRGRAVIPGPSCWVRRLRPRPYSGLTMVSILVRS